MLTAKQEKFCRLMASGKGQTEAYRLSYNCENMKPETVNNNGYILMQKSEIKARIKELQEELKEKTKITVEKMIEELKEIEELARQPIHGRDKNNYDLTNWIKVKQEINKLVGLYAPTKTEIIERITIDDVISEISSKQ